jgi:hypothetical protein
MPPLRSPPLRRPLRGDAMPMPEGPGAGTAPVMGERGSTPAGLPPPPGATPRPKRPTPAFPRAALGPSCLPAPPARRRRTDAGGPGGGHRPRQGGALRV